MEYVGVLAGIHASSVGINDVGSGAMGSRHD
jgi:hypothetical protein